MKRTNKSREIRRAVGQKQIRTLAEIRKCDGTFVPKRVPRVERRGDGLTMGELAALQEHFAKARDVVTRKELDLAKAALEKLKLGR
tara:strand:- start:281 stop:538 length:258 start_codon:yes stop_codon:yes gene_type:complete